MPRISMGFKVVAEVESEKKNGIVYLDKDPLYELLVCF